MSFESIFSTKQNTNPNLAALFKSKKSSNPTSDKIVRLIEKEIKKVTEENETTPKEIQPVEEKLSRRKAAAAGRVKRERDGEQESRTIFVGNLPSDTKKEDLKKTFKTYGKIECIRFRNVIPKDLTKNKKFAYITNQRHEHMATINAFIRFETKEVAETALEVNGMSFKDHHLRVDLATGDKKHDNKRSVFLGGLPFDTNEETLYKTFAECGKIEAVRLIRDNKTGIGKGIGYVCFSESGSVNLALKLNGIEIADRKIRVERCSKKQKEKSKTKEKTRNVNKPKNNNKNSTKSNSKSSSRSQNSKKRKHISTSVKETKRVRI